MFESTALNSLLTSIVNAIVVELASSIVNSPLVNNKPVVWSIDLEYIIQYPVNFMMMQVITAPLTICGGDWYSNHCPIKQRP